MDSKDPIFVRQMKKILQEIEYEYPDVEVDSAIHLLRQKFKEIVRPEMTQGFEVNAQVVPFSNAPQNFVPIAQPRFIKNLNYVHATPVKGLKHLINSFRETQ